MKIIPMAVCSALYPHYLAQYLDHSRLSVNIYWVILWNTETSFVSSLIIKIDWICIGKRDYWNQSNKEALFTFKNLYTDISIL